MAETVLACPGMDEEDPVISVGIPWVSRKAGRPTYIYLVYNIAWGPVCVRDFGGYPGD